MTAIDHRPYLFDARSANWSRTTGWERYTREIARRLEVSDPLVRTRTAGSPAVASRLWQDAAAVPSAARSSRVVHFPTVPPVPWCHAGAVVYTVHDLTWWQHRDTASFMGRHYYAPLARSAVRRCHVVTGTAAIAGDITDYFGLDSEDVSVIPLGVDLAPSPRPLVRDRPYLLTVGTVEPRKNLARLVEAYTRSGIADTHDLLVVGRAGWGTAPDGVEVMSDLDDDGLAAAYSGASALVLASVYEGFGLPVVEAMMLGVPVLCSDTPVLREVSGGHARYLDPLDIDSIVAALRDATSLTAPPEAAEWARDRWNWDRTVTLLSELYRRLDPGPVR